MFNCISWKVYKQNKAKLKKAKARAAILTIKCAPAATFDALQRV